MQKPLISVGELIDQSWDVYKSRAVELLSISGWLILTAILLAISLAFYPSASRLQLGANLTAIETIGILLFSFTTLVIAPILSFWVYTSITKALGEHFARRRPEPKIAMREGRKVFLQAALTSVMVVLMVLLAIVIGFAPAVIIATIGSLLKISALIILANILLIIGIFISLFLFCLKI